MYSADLVGTGDTGVAATFITVGLMYGSVMLLAASQHRVAPPGYVPEGFTPPKEEALGSYVHIVSRTSIAEASIWVALFHSYIPKLE